MVQLVQKQHIHHLASTSISHIQKQRAELARRSDYVSQIQKK